MITRPITTIAAGSRVGKSLIYQYTPTLFKGWHDGPQVIIDTFCSGVSDSVDLYFACDLENVKNILERLHEEMPAATVWYWGALPDFIDLHSLNLINDFRYLVK
jgi:hypothetical protein